MRDISSEEVCEYQAHDEKCEHRREKTPKDSEVRALIFLFKVSFYKLGKKKRIVLDFRNHISPSANRRGKPTDFGGRIPLDNIVSQKNSARKSLYEKNKSFLYGNN